jgi:hypothetical protein
MTQNDFNRAFSSQAFSHVPPAHFDARYIVETMLKRDQLLMRVFAALSLFFWLVATAGMLLLVYGLNRFVLYIRIAHFTPDSKMPAPSTSPIFGPDQEMLWGTSLIHHSLPYIAGSMVAFMLAALFTVLLVFSSRQATLMRINLSLMQISEELKNMRASKSTINELEKEQS